MSERETGAQKQVRCHYRNAKEGQWECQLPGVQSGWACADELYCPTCGTGLRADGTEQARCDVVTSEAVKGTRLWELLADCAAPDGCHRLGYTVGGQLHSLYLAGLLKRTGSGDETRYILTEQGKLILAALQQSPALAPAGDAFRQRVTDLRDLATRYSRKLCDGNTTPVEITEQAPDMMRTLANELAAALAATATGPSEGEMLDALESHAVVMEEICNETGCICDEGLAVSFDTVGYSQYDSKPQPTFRDLARALLAQAGGAK